LICRIQARHAQESSCQQPEPHPQPLSVKKTQIDDTRANRRATKWQIQITHRLLSVRCRAGFIVVEIPIVQRLVTHRRRRSRA
jgi:hypothetical protein